MCDVSRAPEAKCHDVANITQFREAIIDSDSVRYILMMMVWHPDLTDEERVRSSSRTTASGFTNCRGGHHRHGISIVGIHTGHTPCSTTRESGGRNRSSGYSPCTDQARTTSLTRSEPSVRFHPREESPHPVPAAVGRDAREGPAVWIERGPRRPFPSKCAICR